MPARLFVDCPLHAGQALELPPGAARHVQVLRLQPGAPLILFNGAGGEWCATVLTMGRREVFVQLEEHIAVEREMRLHVTLALGVAANERMDAVVEKATELGVSTIQPLICERAVLRLSGERAVKKVAHWQAVALSACEQSGRTQIPRVDEISAFGPWLQALGSSDAVRWLLSLGDAPPISAMKRSFDRIICLSGPEGGLSPVEEHAARAVGFEAVSLGPRVLRADTAPLALLAHLGMQSMS